MTRGETEAWIRENVKAGIEKAGIRKISELLTDKIATFLEESAAVPP
jgi:hypothetical protein